MALVRSSRPQHRLRGTNGEPDAGRRNARVHATVLDAAARLIRRHGYNRVTIEAIAAEAGAGKQTIYRWWPSKAALCLELQAASAPALKPSRRSGPLSTDLGAAIRRIAAGLASGPMKAVLPGLAAEAAHDPEVARSLREHLVRRHRTLLRPILDRAQKRGELRRGADLDLAVDVVTSAIWFRLLLGQAATDRRFLQRLAVQLLKGLSVR